MSQTFGTQTTDAVSGEFGAPVGVAGHADNLTPYAKAILRVVKDADHLSVPCQPVVDDGFHYARKVCNDLVSTAKDLDSGEKLTCRGLAANQLGYNQRIIVVRVGKKFKAFINPEITFKQHLFKSTEGCFSFPGKLTDVTRAKRVIVRASNIAGSKTLRGIEAVAFQHEVDHLNGVLI